MPCGGRFQPGGDRPNIKRTTRGRSLTYVHLLTPLFPVLIPALGLHYKSSLGGIRHQNPEELSSISNSVSLPKNNANSHILAEATALFYAFHRNIINNNNDDDASRRAQTETIYEATGLMLADLAAEESRYLDNMAVLLEAMRRKWKTDWDETGRYA